MTSAGPEISPTNIIFLHGVNNTAADWAAVRDHLSPGESAALELPPVADVDEIADAIEPSLGRGAVLIGHSFGGYVALAVLAKFPHRVRGLVLVNSHDGADGPEARARREASVSKARAGEYFALAQAATAASYTAEHLDDAEMMAQRKRALENYGAEKFMAHQMAAAARPDRRDVLANAEIPVLVVAAADDRVIPTERQREMAQAVAADFVVIEGAGHMLPAEQPAPLAAAINEWLTGSGIQ
ncbi:alpha/beta fold hydrolase [Gephyromycinifex aptenodytis]|uniref:alpha/beta fold hydrolase n=1 Tax=Gephyromycinifex aptenodytis TaxID=2716227 RepID=UPI00144575BB|nr:alpha/beta hydrolase [Gephyromycinifex aptenodytis]